MDKLNPQQLEAVETINGPVLVLAGAGSGKTRVLTHRIAYLIKNGIPARNILAVTFTNKAAYEMQTRVKTLLEGQDNTKDLVVSTFHSLGCRILRKNIKLLDYRENFKIVDEDDSIKYIKDAVERLNIDKKTIVAREIKDQISRIKNNEDLNLDEDEKNKVFSIFNKYQELLFNDNVVDFDDLLGLTEKIFLDHPEVLDYYQERFQYIMIDEFQDTNKIQFNLVKLLGNKYKNIFIVGDQDQSIYSFRGANYKNIYYFTKTYPEYKLIKLETNYRSTPEILSAANYVIKNNTNRIKKTLVANNKSIDLPIYFRAKTSYEETMYVAEKIKSLVNLGYKYSDIVVLYRSNSISRNFEDSFLNYRIPYVIYGGLSFFSRMEIKDLVAYLRVILDSEDNFSFKRILPIIKGIGKEKISKLEDEAIANNISMFDAVEITHLSKNDKAAVSELKENIIYLRSILEDTRLSNFIDILIEKVKYKEHLERKYFESLEDKLDNIQEFKSVIFESKEVRGGDTNKETLLNLLSDLELRTDQDKNINTTDSVVLSTYHQIKGLEFKVVFMVAMENGIFPLNKCLYNNEELEEERRVCYVGITRAKEKLYFTNAISRLHYGSVNQFQKSIFLNEIPSENLKVIGENKRTPINPYIRHTQEINQVEVDNSDIKLGTKIEHKAFGIGIVVNVDENIITVAFNHEYGIKKLMKNHPTIQIIKENKDDEENY